MKPNHRINSFLLTGFVVLLAACQYRINPAHTPTPLEHNPLSLSQVKSPLPTVIASLNAVSAYRTTLHQEIRYAQPDGSTFSAIVESTYIGIHTQGQYGYNEHKVTTLTEPQFGTQGVIDESYMVDDLAFTFCQTCPDTGGQRGWSVNKRNEDNMAGFATGLDIDRFERITGSSLVALVAQGIVVGDENISGMSTTHYRLTDVQALSDSTHVRIGGPSNITLEISTAQMDIWLTVNDHQPIQYTFQATGRTETVVGSQLLQPFTLQERCSITEINSALTITVPTQILTAVAPQLER